MEIKAVTSAINATTYNLEILLHANAQKDTNATFRILFSFSIKKASTDDVQAITAKISTIDLNVNKENPHAKSTK